MSTPFHVFVYGTLKPGERAFARFCQPYVEECVAAIAPGRLYHLSLGYPAMTQEDGWVQGVRLKFSQPHVLAAMDEFEEYFPQRPAASQYQRVALPIFQPSGESFSSAWVYIMDVQKVQAFAGLWLPEGVWSAKP